MKVRVKQFDKKVAHGKFYNFLAQQSFNSLLTLLQYLPLRDFDEITDALNFDTADCHVLGGCDVYTTKAAGSDKKLYKDIEKSLESQYASVLSFSASLSSSQAQAAGPSLNLSRASPFGSLSQHSSRRTFAYLIATLNASHPDYDFSHLLRPSDFRREKSLKKVINTLDTTLYNLHPSHASSLAFSSTASLAEEDISSPDFAASLSSSSSLSTSATLTPSPPSGSSMSEKWNPRMWHLIDTEMSLKDCTIYAYTPDEDPYDGEEGSLWSFNYFFFNKAKKRVCYLHLRGISMIDSGINNSGILTTPIGSKTPASAAGGMTPTTPGGFTNTERGKRCASGTWSINSMETGQKRARFWLGDRAGDAELIVVGDDDDENDNDGDLVANPAMHSNDEADDDNDEDDEPREIDSHGHSKERSTDRGDNGDDDVVSQNHTRESSPCKNRPARKSRH